MKKAKKLLLLSVLSVSCAAALTGCNRGSGGGDQVLRIFCTDAGYKTDWLQPMIDAFKEQDWVKEKYPNLEVKKPETSKNQNYVQDIIAAGRKANRFDLMFGMNLFTNVSDGEFLDLTDCLYNQEIPDSKGGLYKDRMFDSYLDSFQYHTNTEDSKNGHFFLAPWAGGNVSFLYNPELLQSINGKVPNTTDEFLALCEAYTTKNYKGDNTQTYAFLKGNDEDYINKLFSVWWAQYQGLEGYDNFYSGIDDGAISKDIFKQKGRLESLKVFENFLDDSKHYVSPASYQNGFLVNQRAFKGGASLFYACGDWYPSEMANIHGLGGKDYEAKMMRMPVISAITKMTDTIEDDAELSALITAIDNENTSLVGEGYDVNQDDYDKVKEARGVVTSFGAGHTSIVPVAAPGKDVAVDFLRFMATIKGQETYMENTLGASLPFKYDVAKENPTLFNSDKIDPMHKDRLQYMNSSFLSPYTLKSVTSYSLVVYGYVSEFETSTLSIDYFSVFSSDKEHPSAQDYYDKTIAYWTDERWVAAVDRAGLNM